MEKQEYKEIRQGTKCTTCLGCNLLLNTDFIGYYRCENYARGVNDDNKNTTYVQK